ncbi:hypothetical protein [Actinomadura alba]|uniref:hypothetical protein n=1 Tax=Actinomadura alba TaxID=406431 RepID=UPI001FE72BC6|nr:hypothetical protein [Actinomadura alba]
MSRGRGERRCHDAALIAPQTFYDLIKGFEAGVALFYSASPGSIKRALDTLLARGFIEVASIEAGGRGGRCTA